MRRAEQSIMASQETARRLYGRDIAHVMLLHIGSFETRHAAEAAGPAVGCAASSSSRCHRRRAIPSTRTIPNRGFSFGTTLLDQMAAVKRITRPAAPPADELGKIGGLCR